ncbi:MAG: hypothetical protein HY896_10630 [Deltaproteobacteria bacterium]|nr:hypothetical protein [Deltaproteobacteria bacterium]
MILDLSLGNADLYRGLKIENLAGKLTLLDHPEKAISVIASNLKGMEIDNNEVVLTGGMAIWVYLVVFHFLHGRTKRIYYEDGRGNRILVAAHG